VKLAYLTAVLLLALACDETRGPAGVAVAVAVVEGAAATG